MQDKNNPRAGLSAGAEENNVCDLIVASSIARYIIPDSARGLSRDLDTLPHGTEVHLEVAAHTPPELWVDRIATRHDLRFVVSSTDRPTAELWVKALRHGACTAVFGPGVIA